MSTIDSNSGTLTVAQQLQFQLETAEKSGSNEQKDQVLSKMTKLFKEQLEVLKNVQTTQTLRPAQLRDIRTLYKTLEANKKDFDVLLNGLGGKKDEIALLLKKGPTVEKSQEEESKQVRAEAEFQETGGWKGRTDEQWVEKYLDDFIGQKNEILRTQGKKEAERYTRVTGSWVEDLIKKNHPLVNPSDKMLEKAKETGVNSLFELLKRKKDSGGHGI